MAKNAKPKKNSAVEDALFPAIEFDGCTSEWITDPEEGRLAIDIFETDKEIVLRSAIAGVTREDLDIFLHNDMLTIRGLRRIPAEKDTRDIIRECHWGPFSRSIILPTDIDPDSITAVLKDGVLTVRLLKIDRSKRVTIKEA